MAYKSLDKRLNTWYSVPIIFDFFMNGTDLVSLQPLNPAHTQVRVEGNPDLKGYIEQFAPSYLDRLREMDAFNRAKAGLTKVWGIMDRVASSAIGSGTVAGNLTWSAIVPFMLQGIFTGSSTIAQMVRGRTDITRDFSQDDRIERAEFRNGTLFFTVNNPRHANNTFTIQLQSERALNETEVNQMKEKLAQSLQGDIVGSRIQDVMNSLNTCCSIAAGVAMTIGATARVIDNIDEKHSFHDRSNIRAMELVSPELVRHYFGPEQESVRRAVRQLQNPSLAGYNLMIASDLTKIGPNFLGQFGNIPLGEITSSLLTVGFALFNPVSIFYSMGLQRVAESKQHAEDLERILRYITQECTTDIDNETFYRMIQNQEGNGEYKKGLIKAMLAAEWRRDTKDNALPRFEAISAAIERKRRAGGMLTDDNLNEMAETILNNAQKPLRRRVKEGVILTGEYGLLAASMAFTGYYGYGMARYGMNPEAYLPGLFGKSDARLVSGIISATAVGSRLAVNELEREMCKTRGIKYDANKFNAESLKFGFGILTSLFQNPSCHALVSGDYVVPNSLASQSLALLGQGLDPIVTVFTTLMSRRGNATVGDVIERLICSDDLSAEEYIILNDGDFLLEYARQLGYSTADLEQLEVSMKAAAGRAAEQHAGKDENTVNQYTAAARRGMFRRFCQEKLDNAALNNGAKKHFEKYVALTQAIQELQTELARISISVPKPPVCDILDCIAEEHPNMTDKEKSDKFHELFPDVQSETVKLFAKSDSEDYIGKMTKELAAKMIPLLKRHLQHYL